MHRYSVNFYMYYYVKFLEDFFTYRSLYLGKAIGKLIFLSTLNNIKDNSAFTLQYPYDATTMADGGEVINALTRTRSINTR